MGKLFIKKERDVLGTDRTGKKFKFDRVVTNINGRSFSLKSKGSAYEVLNDMLDKNEKLELFHKKDEYTDFNTGEIKEKDMIYVLDPDGDELEVKAIDSYAKNKIIKALTK